MRVTFLLPEANLSGGVRIAVSHAERLKQRGHEVTIVTRPRSVPTMRDRARALVKGEGWLMDPNQLPSHLDHTTVPVKTIESRRAIVDADVPDADAVIATWWETAEWAATLSPQKGDKYIFLQHDERVFEGQPKDRVAATW